RGYRLPVYAWSPPINSALSVILDLASDRSGDGDCNRLVDSNPSRATTIARRDFDAPGLSWPRNCRARVGGSAHAIPNSASAYGIVAAARNCGLGRSPVLRT